MILTKKRFLAFIFNISCSRMKNVWILTCRLNFWAIFSRLGVRVLFPRVVIAKMTTKIDWVSSTMFMPNNEAQLAPCTAPYSYKPTPRSSAQRYVCLHPFFSPRVSTSLFLQVLCNKMPLSVRKGNRKVRKRRFVENQYTKNKKARTDDSLTNVDDEASGGASVSKVGLQSDSTVLPAASFPSTSRNTPPATPTSA